MYVIDAFVNRMDEVGKITEFQMPIFEHEDDPIYVDMCLYGYLEHEVSLFKSSKPGNFIESFRIIVNDEGDLIIKVGDEFVYSTIDESDMNLSLLVFAKYIGESFICYFGKNAIAYFPFDTGIDPRSGKFSNDMSFDDLYKWYVRIMGIANNVNNCKGYRIRHGSRNVIFREGRVRV